MFTLQCLWKLWIPHKKFSILHRFDFFGNWLHNHSSSIHINCQHQKIGIPDSQISPSCYQESKLSSIKASNESDPRALMNWTSFSFTLADSWPWCSLISCNCLVEVVECMCMTDCRNRIAHWELTVGEQEEINADAIGYFMCFVVKRSFSCSWNTYLTLTGGEMKKIQFSQSMICRVQVVSDCDTLNIWHD